MTSQIISVSQRVKQIKPSPTLSVNAKANALKASGADILNFSVGEPDFDTPLHVREAGKAAIDEGFTRYTAVPGIPALREAIAQRYAEDKGWQYEPDQIQVSCGGKHGLYNMAQALFNPGDEVLIPTPYWVSYPPIVLLAGAVPVEIPLSEDNDFDLDEKLLAKYATDKTRGIILNSPSNPTGAVFSQKGLEAVAKMALEKGWVVISDDIYDTIVYGADSIPHILEIDGRLKEQTLILNGVSKSFAMTGWRIGYTLGPKHIILYFGAQAHHRCHEQDPESEYFQSFLRGPEGCVGCRVRPAGFSAPNAGRVCAPPGFHDQILAEHTGYHLRRAQGGLLCISQFFRILWENGQRENDKQLCGYGRLSLGRGSPGNRSRGCLWRRQVYSLFLCSGNGNIRGRDEPPAEGIGRAFIENSRCLIVFRASWAPLRSRPKSNCRADVPLIILSGRFAYNIGKPTHGLSKRLLLTLNQGGYTIHL